MKFFAHTTTGPPTDWEPLFTPGCETLTGDHCEKCANLAPDHGHLNKVAHVAAQFAAEMFPPGPDREASRQWGHLAGLWHDLGKFAPKWQTYLASKADPHKADATGTVDHSTAGAQNAVRAHPLFGRLLAFTIAGHHAGLADGISDSAASLEIRLKKSLPELCPIPAELANHQTQLPPPQFALKSGHSMAFFLRLHFSALVDADFLATESFMRPDIANVRPAKTPAIPVLEAALIAHLDEVSRNAPKTPVNRERASILQHCLTAASGPPGLFSLTVPTGGGKTLSSLAFALRHARQNDLRRVIYVIPYTSIIEQNATAFRHALAALGDDIVLEHHSNLNPDGETQTSRLAAENWDARIIVTTNVQFFESLHANRTSRCRKLHRIARSVVILDEAQSLPLDYLHTCLRALTELTENYQTSVVLCTATQPAVTRSAEFRIGLPAPREIIPDPVDLYNRLRRVIPQQLPDITDNNTLVRKLVRLPQVLCIVNTRAHARDLFESLPADNSRFHLSALMCPQHRAEKLAEIKDRLQHGQSVRLISTQLIEAGVDIDFPVVYRALAGLDSIAQAAGRCDREGRLTAAKGAAGGQLFIFRPEKLPPPGFIRSTADSASAVLACDPPDPLDLDTIESYFRTHFWKHNDDTDKHDILGCWPKEDSRWPQNEKELLLFDFKKCADRFHLIDDYSEPVIVPYGPNGKELVEALRFTYDPGELRQLARQLQRYSVNIPSPQHAQLRQAGILQAFHEDRFFVLNSYPHYSDEFGLHPSSELTLSSDQSIL